MLKNIFTNSIGILLSRIFGFIRDLLMASVLGANIYSDIFFVAFKLPNLFRRIFAEGAFTQVFIPAYANTKYKIQFSTIVFLQFFLFIIFLSIFVTFFSTFITKLIALGFDVKTVNVASSLVAICFYYLPLIFIVTFLAALLQYRHHFATTAFGTILLNISLIIALIVSRGSSKYTIIVYLSWAVVAGGILQVIAHLIAIKALKIKVFTIKIQKSKNKFYKSKFYSQFYLAIFGNSASHISAFLDTWLASFLSFGSISYLYYSNRIFQLPLAIFAIATSVALFPTIAKAIKNENEKYAIKILQKYLGILIVLLFIATVIGIVFDNEIVKLLFQRGEFGNFDTNKTSLVLSMYLLGLLPFGISKLLSLWLYAKKQQQKVAKITAISLIWNILLSIILIVPFDVAGLALASSISGYILLHLILKEFGYNNLVEILKYQR